MPSHPDRVRHNYINKPKQYWSWCSFPFIMQDKWIIYVVLDGNKEYWMITKNTEVIHFIVNL